MILPILHKLTQSRFKLGAAALREAALENGKLNPFPIPVHDLEHAPSALRVGNVIRYNEEAFVGHGGTLSAACSEDRSPALPKETGIATAPEPAACDAC